jgi:hypothetical protein
MTVKLAMYKGKGNFFNKFIRFWTRSEYSHCELVVDGYCYSSSGMDKGIRMKPVGKSDNQISLSPDNWDLIDIPWVARELVLEYVLETDSHMYGYFCLITSQLFNRALGQYRAQFCSEWCARAMGLPNASAYSPATLGDMCKWLLDKGVK